MVSTWTLAKGKIMIVDSTGSPLRGVSMKSTRRRQTVDAILRQRVSAIIRTSDQRIAAEAIEAAVDGGFRVVEFTLTPPGAIELIAEFSRRDELVVGAGTVLTIAQARESVEAGACFVVSPICDPVILAEAARLDVAAIPGAFTPTEMETAHRCGADFVKVFPAPPGGVTFIEAIRAPLPHLRLFPTAGFTTENFLDYLKAGCAGVGFVRPLFDPSDLAAGNFAAIRERAAGIIRRLSDWRR
jgi:2-dehydro-3-deoxyphosphogluconate aldolase/(4S)-4-hydroxy-2-oxoglutarate aldolase